MQTAVRSTLYRTNARLLIRRTTTTRSASTSTPTEVVVPSPAGSGFTSTLKTTAFVLGTGLFVAYYYDSRSAIHQYVIPPLMRATLDPEDAHRLALRVLRSPFAPKDRGVDDVVLKCTIWDMDLPSPVGLAAGFDKDGEAIDGLFNLGFDWVEIGSVTPKPQPGNPKPRVFTLPEDNAMINRYGFPSRGHDIMLARLRSRNHSSYPPPEQASGRVLAVNLGKNKSSSPDSIADYLVGVKRFGAHPDVGVLVINVSSPNTPGLRGLQNRGMLEELLDGVGKARDEIPVAGDEGVVAREGVRIRTTRPKIVLKIAPDLDELAIQDIAEAVRESKVDGVIVSNTTIQRPDLQSGSAKEIGGLSGPPLFPLSLKALSILRSHLPAEIPIIGCGGISSGSDALAFARAGASAVQLYTSFGYSGVGTARRIKDELTEELRREGKTWAQVVDEARSKAWVKPKGQKGLDEGEKELRDMLDVLGRQAAVGEEVVVLEDRPRGLRLDNETRRIAELAEAAISSGTSGPRGGRRLAHAQDAAPALTASSAHGEEGSELVAHERALERRRHSGSDYSRSEHMHVCVIYILSGLTLPVLGAAKTSMRYLIKECVIPCHARFAHASLLLTVLFVASRLSCAAGAFLGVIAGTIESVESVSDAWSTYLYAHSSFAYTHLGLPCNMIEVKHVNLATPNKVAKLVFILKRSTSTSSAYWRVPSLCLAG